MADFLLAYCLTILIEGAILILLLRNEYDLKLIIRNAIIASSITLPFVWFLFPVLSFQSWVLQVALAESFAFLVETLVYRYMFAGIQWKSAFLASLICNAISFAVGFFIL